VDRRDASSLHCALCHSLAEAW